MAFDDLKAELALLINQMENQPEDPHELYLQIREKLNEMRAFGMPLTAIPVVVSRSFHHGAIWYDTKSGIRGPKDIEGKTVAFSPGDSPKLMFPAFAKANGIDESKVK